MSLNHLFSDGSDKPFHSSGYAEVAYGSRLGATSYQPFSERARINNNRQSVQGYRFAAVTHKQEYVSPGAGQSFSDEAGRHRLQVNQRQSTGGVPARTHAAAQSRPQTAFREPPTRGYNPYA